MNFVTANLDFRKTMENDFREIHLLSLRKGLPENWKRPGLLEAYRHGVSAGIFYPALHGLTHFCRIAAENALAENAERASLLRAFWEAETPYIYWRMPWVGYEYWNPEKPHAGFLPYKRQQSLIQKSCGAFSSFFGTKPLSACAAGYRANDDTHRAWAEAGIRVVQNGSGSGLKASHVDEFGLLHLYRAIDVEPSQKELDIEKHLEIAAACVARGLPIVISTHAINFHSSLKDFRTSTLIALDALLKALESKYPYLLYVNDEELYTLVTDGHLRNRSQRVTVSTAPFERRAAVMCAGTS